MSFTNELKLYIEQNYSEKPFVDSLCNLSKGEGTNRESLVDSQKEVYNFDKIEESLSVDESVRWCSADALLFDGNNTFFIEFKKGFLDRRTKKEKRELYKCPAQRDCCEQVEGILDGYNELFETNRMNEKKILMESLRIKLFETLKILECQLIPKSGIKASPQHLAYICVVDRKYLKEPSAVTHDVMLELAKKGTQADASLISDHLNKYRHLLKESNLNFETIEVLEKEEFQSRYPQFMEKND